MGILKSIKKDNNFVEEKVKMSCESNIEGKMSQEQQPIVFISHKSSDSKYGEVLRNLLLQNGVKNEQIIFTSNSSKKIPCGLDIFNYLKTKIHSKTFVLYLLSNDYFESPGCLNEMRAAGWFRQIVIHYIHQVSNMTTLII